MLKFQIDQYDMMLSTENHLNVNAALFAANLPLVASKTLLSSQIDGLAAQIATQLINPTGVTVEKDNLRAALQDQTFVLGAACCSYATATANPDLYNRCRYTKSDLLHLRDAELIGICTNMHADVTAHAAALLPYSVSAGMITAYQASLTAFAAAISNPAEAIARRTTATAQIADLLPEIAEMMSTRLDNDIVSMTSTQPDFVSTYYNVRKITDSPTTRLSLTVTVLDNVTNLPVPNADLLIVGENITRKSSARGYNTVLNLIPGNHTLEISRPDYHTQNIPFTVVSGETTELIVMFKKI